MSLIYSTNPNESTEDSIYKRMAEIKAELDTLPELPPLNYLSDICEDYIRVEWESDFGRHWEQFDSLEELYETVQKNDEVNKPYTRQSELHEELLLIDLQIREEEYQKDLNENI